MKVVPVNENHPLGALIEEVLERNDWSTRDLSARTKQMGTYMSHTNFNRLKNEPLTSIKGSTIKLLAAVLQVPEARVTRAALDSMGVQHSIEDAPGLVDFVHSTSEISARDRRLLTAMVEAMRETEDEATHEQEQSQDNVTPLYGDSRQRRSYGLDEKMGSAADTGERHRGIGPSDEPHTT